MPAMQAEHWEDGDRYDRTWDAGADWSPPGSWTGSRFHPEARWLDVGCGTGALSETILSRADPVEVRESTRPRVS